MKKIFFCLTLLLLAFTACKKMDSMYRGFIVPGGITYVGKANFPIANVGHNRIKISWLKGSDPTVTKAKIFWNNYTDSVEINIPPIGDTISVVINNLPEKSYSFIIKTYNSEGLSSVPVELISRVYGDNYQANLMNRNISSSVMDAQGGVTLQWTAADISNGAYAMEVTYTNNAGELKMQRFAASQSSSVISDYKDGTTFKYRTAYLPDSSSIDTFYTDFAIQHVSKKIAKTNWIATADSYTSTGLGTSGPTKCAIDDNITTYWMSLSPSTTAVYPHWFTVDMKQVINVSNVELTYRQNTFTSFTDFLIQGSLDGVNWTTYISYNFQLINDPQRYFIPNSPKMQYIRLYLTKGPNAYAHLAEFSVFGY